MQVLMRHRREVVTRRTVFTLRKARERGHVLEGLAVALANIDDFIAIIRNAPTPPVAKAELMLRPWDSSLVREMLTRTRADGGIVNADDYRPDGLEKGYGMGSDGLYPFDTQDRNPAMRLQAPDGLEQDKIVAEYKEVMRRSTPSRIPHARAGLTIIGEDGVSDWNSPDKTRRPPQAH